MNQYKYKVLWVDDDIKNPEMRPDKLALSRMDCDIIEFDNPDSFIDYISNKRNSPDTIDCIIIDLSMSIGKKIRKDANKETSTGLILLKKVNESHFKDSLIIVYTITDNEKVRNYCQQHDNIPYWNKMDYLSDEFAEQIVETINERTPNHV